MVGGGHWMVEYGGGGQFPRFLEPTPPINLLTGAIREGGGLEEKIIYCTVTSPSANQPTSSQTIYEELINLCSM